MNIHYHLMRKIPYAPAFYAGQNIWFTKEAVEQFVKRSPLGWKGVQEYAQSCEKDCI